MINCMTISGTVTPIDGRTDTMLQVIREFELTANATQSGAWEISGVCFKNVVVLFIRSLAQNVESGEIDAERGLCFTFCDGKYGAFIG